MLYSQIYANFKPQIYADGDTYYCLILRKSAIYLRKSTRNIFIIVLLYSACYAQDTTYLRYTETITSDELSTHVYTLASEEMEGRFTGSRGMFRAKNYIATEFESYQIKQPVIGDRPTYSQDFALEECRWKDQRLVVDGEEFRVGKDFLFLSDPVSFSGNFPVVFAGFGVDDSVYSDFGNIDVKGKIMLAYSGEPRNSEGNSCITGTREFSKKGYYFSKAAMAANLGAKGVFIISRQKSDYKKFLKAREYYNPKPVITYPRKGEDSLHQKPAFAAYMNVKTAAKLVGEKPAQLQDALKEMESRLQTTAGRFSGQVSIEARSECSALPTANVVGMIEGTDLAHETVVVVAHYDHLGYNVNGIYYGADDNASGTAAVMEIAEAFSLAAQKGLRPRRTVIFLAVSGEELGLYGSKYYTEHPLISLDSTYACVNIDMIGRASRKLENSPDYISGYVYESQELLEVSREACSITAPDLEDRIEYRKSLRGGSDHYYFAEQGIPAIFYFTGFHDDYHEVTDTPDKILYDRMEKIVRTIFATTWELANREGNW